MADPRDQVATQLANIEASSGLSVDDFVGVVSEAGLEKHGQIVTLLKAEHSMTHGNANLIAHLVRERLAGGKPSDEALIDAQYPSAKAHLRPIYERLVELAMACGGDVEKVPQKTGVSFRRSKQFSLVQAPSSKRVQLSLNLDATPPGERVQEAKGMCTHKVDLTDIAEVDDEVAAWIATAYERAK